MPYVQLETMIGILRNIPHNVLPTLNPKKITLEDCQMVCNRWNQIIVRHPALLPHTRIENLAIWSVS